MKKSLWLSWILPTTLAVAVLLAYWPFRSADTRALDGYGPDPVALARFLLVWILGIGLA